MISLATLMFLMALISPAVLGFVFSVYGVLYPQKVAQWWINRKNNSLRSMGFDGQLKITDKVILSFRQGAIIGLIVFLGLLILMGWYFLV